MTLTERKGGIIFHMVLAHMASLVMVACFVAFISGGPDSLILPIIVNALAFVGNVVFLCIYLSGMDSEA